MCVSFAIDTSPQPYQGPARTLTLENSSVDIFCAREKAWHYRQKYHKYFSRWSRGSSLRRSLRKRRRAEWSRAECRLDKKKKKQICRFPRQVVQVVDGGDGRAYRKFYFPRKFMRDHESVCSATRAKTLMRTRVKFFFRFSSTFEIFSFRKFQIQLSLNSRLENRSFPRLTSLLMRNKYFCDIYCSLQFFIVRCAVSTLVRRYYFFISLWILDEYSKNPRACELNC